ncbi:acetolactate synthase small subunit [Puniceicoccus vermicola]|uniref:Acetolactate synthase small subunit n=1 Tax=Puniceicoccus vermicola TaxID=388746 RepID=A0A7X1B0P4_9BACT|nr:acetolactate synthase small subunit [Puniceicoccus vermicola]MBC2602325.1 acetolactate synthase small subunit [Puniceicoccus vermicola]
MSSDQKHTISVLVENKFGVLARVAGMFSGRGFNIETLNVGPVHLEGLSRITATILGDDQALDQALKQLNKLVNVVEVEHFTEGAAVARELILLKVSADSKTRPEIMQICDIFRAKVIDVSAESVVLEITGNDSKIKAFLDLVDPFGVQKMARTGVVALERGANS